MPIYCDLSRFCGLSNSIMIVKSQYIGNPDTRDAPACAREMISVKSDPGRHECLWPT